jgi:hypothetical protein
MDYTGLAHDAEADESMQPCIDACGHCHETCLHTAMTHCLAAGDMNVEGGHFRLMINCAEICQTSANFLLSGSVFHQMVCAACAEICDACANRCEQVGGMEDCVKACRECAESCRKMAVPNTDRASPAPDHIPFMSALPPQNSPGKAARNGACAATGVGASAD